MDKQVFDSIKKTLAVTLPKRAIALLYGSQARGDARRDSDWDILIVLDKDQLLPDDYDTVTYHLTKLGWDIGADSLSAMLIAKAAWYPLYGKEKIEKEKPFQVTEYKKYWKVEGSLPDGHLGGTAHIVIRKSDGKVMIVWHEK